MKLTLSSALLAASVLSFGRCAVAAAPVDVIPQDNLSQDSASRMERFLHYPYAHVENLSSNDITVKITYASLFCKDDTFSLGPNESWTADSRGVCLITKIESTMTVEGGDINCQSYMSSGTSYSQFYVANLTPTRCTVRQNLSALAPDTQDLEDDATKIEFGNDYRTLGTKEDKGLQFPVPSEETQEMQSQNLQGYPHAHVENLSSNNVSVKVSYASLFCKDDSFTLGPRESWTADSRGICLITKIESTMTVDGGDINCQSYTSSGTSYSQFYVANLTPTRCTVRRSLSALVPANAEEPSMENFGLGRSLRGSRTANN